ncbi:MAG: hypothetical protein EAZ21_09365 [Betaproteobacteria bacterium]|nr:MAG: hypothetical protein EAZ21_09365 [Betaproteobacteria bacterium]
MGANAQPAGGLTKDTGAGASKLSFVCSDGFPFEICAETVELVVPALNAVPAAYPLFGTQKAMCSTSY